MPALVVGQTIAGCRLDAIAGRGGMGVVWRATQLALNRPVAVKAIAPQLAEDESFRTRFQRESLLAASIDHPNVIPVYEAGELDGTLYLIMRWVDGTDLRARLMTDGAMAPGHAVRLLRPVASALAAAHRRGLIHRDVKPANVLITRGDDAADEHVYLTDFGIARRNDSRGMTRTGVLIGTIDYIAPEMIQGERGTSLSDIYGFGCMLFETLTGHVPFPRSTELAKMHAHITDPVPVDELPPALVPIVTRAMAKRPEDRFGSAGELVAALDALGTGTGTGAGTGAGTETGTGAGTETGTAAGTGTGAGTETGTATGAPAPAASDATVLEPPAAETTPAQPPPPTGLETPTTLDRPPVVPPPPPARSAAPPARSAAPAARSAPPAARSAPPAAPSAPPAAPSAPPPAASEPRPGPAGPPRARRRLLLALGLLALVGIVVIVLVATSGGGGSSSGGAHASVGARVVSGFDVAVGTPRSIGAESVALAAGTGDAWAATRDRLIQLAVGGGTQILRQRSYNGPGTGLAVDPRNRLWITGLGRSDGVHQVTGNVVEAGEGTNLLALDSQAAWIGARGASSVIRADLGSLASSPSSVTGPLAAFGVGYGRLWVASSDGHVTVLDADGRRDALPAPNVAPGTVGVAASNGVWFVNGDGTLNRMDPRKEINGVTVSGQYELHPVALRIPGGANAAGAWPKTAAFWVLSPGSKSIVRVGSQGGGNGKITARVTFSVPPAHLAVGDHVVWVDFPNADTVIPITYR